MSKKYTFTMVVVKPTGKGGKPLKPKPIRPKPQQKAGGGMSNKPKDPKIVRLMPKGVFYKGKAKDYPGIKELIKRKNKKAAGGEMLKNPKKADLDKDGKLSGYEKKRGMAIEKNMKPKKAAVGALMLGLGAKKLMDKNKSKAMPIGVGAAAAKQDKIKEMLGKKSGGEIKRGYGAARTSDMGLQDENLVPGKTMDYYKDLM